MKNRLKEKKELFIYFVFKLNERYRRMGSIIKIHRFIVINMLFFACLANKKMLKIGFNKFYSTSKGPVESEVYGFLKKWTSFEKDIDNIEEIKIENKYNKLQVDIAIMGIESFIFNKDYFFLIEYSKTFNCWKIGFKKQLIYDKKAYPISITDILKDCSDNYLLQKYYEKKTY